MPAWVAKEDKLRQRIKEEEARADRLRLEEHEKWRQWQPKFSPTTEPTPMIEPLTSTFEQPIVEENLVAPIQEMSFPSTFQTPEEQWTIPEPTAPEMGDWNPPPITPAIAQQAPTIGKEAPLTEKETKPISVPFWQRALQVFAAPFQWVDENVIKPGLSLVGTTTGVIPEVERLPGEDYWEWKKRSLAGWETPGINIKVPWSDDPLRVDVKGILEFAPWLLLPGAGQVGGGVRGAAGIAGALGKLGKAGKVLGYAVEYSPWGIVEKTAGVAIKAGLKTVMKGAGKVSPAIEAKIFGKIEEPVISPTVKEFTQFFNDPVIPAYKAFKEAEPALRARQAEAIETIRKKVRTGEITPLEATNLEQEATKVGGIKAGYAVQVRGIPEMKIEVNPSLVKEYGANAIFDIRTKTLSFETAEGMANPLLLNHELAHAYVKGLPKGERQFLLEKYAKIIGDEKVTQGRYGTEEFLAQGYADYITKSVPIEEMDKSAVEFFKKLPLELSYLTKGKLLFAPEKVNELLGQIDKSVESGFVVRDASIALRDLLMVGTLPEKHNIRDWAKVFGNEFAQSAMKLRSVAPSKWEQVIDLLNLPRAVLASGDLSATFRQGLILILTRPQDFPRAFGRQLSAFASEKLSLQMDDVLRSRPLYQTLTDKMGIEFTTIRTGARLVSKEEPFFSNLAHGLPLVRRSERAFTTFLNEMRYSAGEAAYNAMIAQGASPVELKLMGKFVNLAGGRGVIPMSLDRFAPVLNTVLFSAKYQMSTLQLPRQIGRMLISSNPYMRKQAAIALGTFVGGGTALLGLLKATGKAKVETDPRSSDFGKIVVGDTRLDIWRGYIQYARFATQLLTEERKSAYGNMNKAERDQTVWRFLQSKSSPAFGLLVDLLKGETYAGEDMLTSTKSTIRAARERLVPLAVQDIIDAMEQYGTNGLWIAAPSVTGVGVLTYINDFVRTKEKIAKQMGYETWDEIDPKTQREIQNTNTELQAANIAFDRKAMGTAWGDWRLAGNAVEDTFRENVGLATNQYRQTGDGFTFREKVGDAFVARRGGYAAREKIPQFEDIVNRLKTQDTAEAMVNLGPEQLAIRTYDDALWGKDMYDEFGDYRFDEAEVRKQQLRQQLGNELFDYVEEYRGVKYETFPPEYQELARAKTVLRPYWEVANTVVQLFGTQFAESLRGQAFIAKEKKKLRLSDPKVEKYYSLFYRQT